MHPRERSSAGAYSFALATPTEGCPMHVQQLLAQAHDRITIERVFGEPMDETA
jgi:hypothetical protein